MQGINKLTAIMISVALAACEKHREKENTDTSAYHHPTNDQGVPVHNPAPEVPPPTQPLKETQGQTNPPNR